MTRAPLRPLPLLFAALFASAQAQPAPERTAVEQKLAFARQLLADSPAVRRIAASGNAQAQADIAEGQAQLTRATEAMRSGDLAAAEQGANAAIWAMGRARQRVPDDMNRAIAERTRYQQLLLSAEKMVPSFRAHLARGGRDDSPDLSAALTLIAQAREHAAAERLAEANRALLDAERHLLVGLSRTIADTTLVYSAHFDSPAREVEYELARHASLVELLPVALAELRPAADAQAQAQRLAERSRELRAQAQRHASANRFDTALPLLHEASQLAQRALTAAGLVMPSQ
jgi:hypothetical protein